MLLDNTICATCHMSIYENCKNNIYPNIDDQYDQAMNGLLVANIPADNDAIALNKAHLKRLKIEDRTNPLVVD